MKRRKRRRIRRNIAFAARCTAIAASAAFLVVGVREACADQQPRTIYAGMKQKELDVPALYEVSAREEEESQQVCGIIPGENLEYPFNTMSFDWSAEQVEGFRAYDLPEDFSMYGGYLPTEVQIYTYILCGQYGVDYPLVLALIEVESGYQWDAKSACNAVGYMQIVEKWHREDMEAVGADNLLNPYQNIRTGIHILSGLMEDYQTSVALTIYNRGYRNQSDTGGLDLMEKGQYTTQYSDKIMERAAEIEGELKDVR